MAEKEKPVAGRTSPSLPAGDVSLNPIGPDFWLGQVVLLGAAVAAIWFAARAGFSEAARFAQYEECRTAQKTIAIVRRELEGNLQSIRDVRERTRSGEFFRFRISTVNLRVASERSFGSLIDPAVLYEVESLFDRSFLALMEAMTHGRLSEEDAGTVRRELERVLERAQRVVEPMLERQEQVLREAESRLR